MLTHHHETICISEVSNRPNEKPHECNQAQNVEHQRRSWAPQHYLIRQNEQVDADGKPNQKDKDADSYSEATHLNPVSDKKVPLGCSYYVGDEVEKQGNYYCDVVDFEEKDFASISFRSLLRDVVKHFDAPAWWVGEIVPVDLFFTLESCVTRSNCGIRAEVFHCVFNVN